MGAKHGSVTNRRPWERMGENGREWKRMGEDGKCDNWGRYGSVTNRRGWVCDEWAPHRLVGADGWECETHERGGVGGASREQRSHEAEEEGADANVGGRWSIREQTVDGREATGAGASRRALEAEGSQHERSRGASVLSDALGNLGNLEPHLRAVEIEIEIG